MLPTDYDELQAAIDEEILLANDDLVYYLTHFGWMKDETTGEVIGPGIPLWPEQVTYARLLETHRRLILLKTRKGGFSWLTRNKEYRDLQWKARIRQAIIDKREEDAGTHLDWIKWIDLQVRTHTPHMAPRPIRSSNTEEFSVGTEDDFSIIKAYPCTAGALRGPGVYSVCLEEYAFWQNPGQVWPAVVGAANSPLSQITIISTANGEGGDDHGYFKKWTDAVAGTNGFTTFFAGWQIDPRRDQAWKDAKDAELGKADSDAEYPGSPAVAFKRSGSPYFDQDLFEKLEAQQIERYLEGELWTIYEEPIPGRAYAIGADVADGGGDACFAACKDVETGETVAEIHSYDLSADDFGDHLFLLGKMYGWALLGVERNNGGVATLAVLARAKYRNLYREHHWDKVKQKNVPGELGWWTGENRSLMLGAYGRALRTKATRPAGVEAIRQARIFQHNKRTKRPDAPDGDHDDCVFGEGIAWQMVLWARDHKPREIEYYLGDSQL